MLKQYRQYFLVTFIFLILHGLQNQSCFYVEKNGQNCQENILIPLNKYRLSKLLVSYFLVVPSF